MLAKAFSKHTLQRATTTLRIASSTCGCVERARLFSSAASSDEGNNSPSKPHKVYLGEITGTGPEEFFQRRVKIYSPSKSAMQSGTQGYGKWKLEFENQGRWENPLMGWTSTRDTATQIYKLYFDTKEQAVEYCMRQGFEFDVGEIVHKKKFKPKAYADNYSFKKYQKK